MGRDEFERNMADELAFHVDARTEDLIRAGVPEEEARRRARFEFGGVTTWKERCRETRSFRPLDELRVDLRYGIRTLAKSPAFTLAAILSLAIGIGVNTAIFSVIDALVFRPIAVPDEGRVTRLFTTSPQDNEGAFSWPEYQEFSRQSRSFTGMVAVGGRGARLRRPDGTFELLLINAVSGNFFNVLGVKAAEGQLFAAEDAHGRAEHPVVALGYGFWQRHYGGDRSVVGRQIRVEGEGGEVLLTVCGVLPESFRGIDAVDRDLWMPPQTFAVLRGRGDLESRGFRWFSVLGRIRPGTAVRTASAEMATVASRLAASWPETNRGRSARAISDFAYRMKKAQGPGIAFLGVVLLVLIMSAVNVANLLMARAAARGQELSIRAAIGAKRSRIVRQMLAESALLGAGGLLTGIATGWAIIKALPAIVGGIPGYPIVLLRSDVDLRVLVFAAALTLATTAFFGLVPAWSASRADLNVLLRQGSESRPARGFQGRRFFVGAQVAMSLALLAVAAVLIESFVRTRTADLGLARREHLLLFCGVEDNNQARVAVSRLRALPGVEEVALAIRAPLSLDEGGRAQRVSFPDRPEIDKAAPLEIKFNAVDSNFLRVMGTPVVWGRGFSEEDQTKGPPVVLISQTMARRYWPGRDAVGAMVRVGAPPGVAHRVIGVAKDVQFNGIDQKPEPYMYLPWYRADWGEATFIVHTRVPAGGLAGPARRALIAIDPRLDPISITTENELIRFSGIQYRLAADLLGTLGLIGLILTAVGLYGVVAWSVTRRTREIGIRIALGASRRETLSLILRQTAVVGGLGMLVGVPLALAATKAASSLLYGTNPWDAGMLALAIAVLAAVMLAAGFTPAWRATRTDPMKALRVE
jgi:predicted permease